MNTPHTLPEVKGGFKILFINVTDKTDSWMIKLHMLPLVQSDLTICLQTSQTKQTPASIIAIRIEQYIYKRYRQSKILHEHTHMLSLI